MKEDIMQGQILAVRYEDGPDIDLGHRVKIRFHAPFGSHEFKVPAFTAHQLGAFVGSWLQVRIRDGKFVDWDAFPQENAS